MREQTTTRWQEKAKRVFPDKQLTGDGSLVVVTADGVHLFSPVPMYLDRDNFDQWTRLLSSDAGNHLVDLRTIRDPEPPKEEPLRKANVNRLWKIPGEGIDE